MQLFNRELTLFLRKNDLTPPPPPLLLCLLIIRQIRDVEEWAFLIKNSLPVVIRNDLFFDESIVVELKFGRKKIFFTVLYRSPAFDHNSPNLQTFLSHFSNLYAKIKAENPFAVFFTGDFNAHSKYWWPDGDTAPEGMEIELLLSSLGLFQVIISKQATEVLFSCKKNRANHPQLIFNGSAVVKVNEQKL